MEHNQSPRRKSLLISQACAVFGVSRRTVYYWIRSGRLQTVRTLGGSQRVLLPVRVTTALAPTSGFDDDGIPADV